MTGQYDGKYLGKIKLLRERLEAISDDKGIYDFAPQIRNDFLSLAVMAVKNEIWRNKKDSVEPVSYTHLVQADCPHNGKDSFPPGTPVL